MSRFFNIALCEHLDGMYISAGNFYKILLYFWEYVPHNSLPKKIL